MTRNWREWKALEKISQQSGVTRNLRTVPGGPRTRVNDHSSATLVPEGGVAIERNHIPAPGTVSGCERVRTFAAVFTWQEPLGKATHGQLCFPVAV